MNMTSGLPHVLQTGEPEYYPKITDEMLVASAEDEEHLASLRELGMKAAMTVPMIARGHILGAISLIWAKSGRKYSDIEVELVEELARRSALAIDNARLYQEAQTFNAELEQRVEKRTRQLASSNKQLLIEVDERRKAEAALRKSKSLLQSLFEIRP